MSTQSKPVTRKEIADKIGMSVEWVRRNDGFKSHRISAVKGRALYRTTVWAWLKIQGFEV